ncbi:hypothetical protein Droror1_Dr00008650 [Drosera rotundifolia]
MQFNPDYWNAIHNQELLLSPKETNISPYTAYDLSQSPFKQLNASISPKSAPRINLERRRCLHSCVEEQLPRHISFPHNQFLDLQHEPGSSYLESATLHEQLQLITSRPAATPRMKTATTRFQISTTPHHSSSA